MESIAKELDILEYKDLFFSENDNRPIIIYGYNNSGKTQFLKKLTKKICYYNLEKIYNKDEKNLKCSIFLGTNRLEEERIGTTPYDYSLKQLHIGYELTRLSDMDKYDERYISSVRIAAMNDPEFIEKVSNAISNLFGLEENFVVSQNEINNYSDGVQNVLNI